MRDKISYLEELYKSEAWHNTVYSKLGKIEKDPELRAILQKLAGMEKKHKSLWARLLKINKIEIPGNRSKLLLYFTILMRKVLGLAVTVKTIEYFESELEKNFNKILKSSNLSAEEKVIVRKIESDENLHERVLEEKLIKYGKILNNIRDIIFGMNDGLVEILAAVVGLAAAITSPSLVLLGGVIVAVSGTLSMAGGAYISTDYEGSIKVRDADRIANTSPIKSAFYTGVPYFFGSLIPIIPFAMGFSGITGIVLSVIFTSIILIIVSMFIAILSGTSMTRRISTTLIISLGATAITIAIGLYARSVLHLTV